MACPQVGTFTDCRELCKFEARNNLRLSLYRPVSVSPTEIQVIYDGDPNDFPCASTFDFGDCKCGTTGYGLYTSATLTGTQCDGGNVWVLSGLHYYFSDCTFTAKPELNIAHQRTEKVNIGNPNLNFWTCRECKCRTELTEESRCVYNNYASLVAAQPNPICGQRCVVVNGGNPILYTAIDIGGGICEWTQVGNVFANAATLGGLGAIGLACIPTNPALPVAYNVGCPAHDALALGSRCGNNLTHPAAFIPSNGSFIVKEELISIPPYPAIDQTVTGTTLVSTEPFSIASNTLLEVMTQITHDSTIKTETEEGTLIWRIEIYNSGATLIDSFSISSPGIYKPAVNQTAVNTQTGFKYVSSTLPADTYEIRVYVDVTVETVDTWWKINPTEIKHIILLNPQC